MWTRLTTLISRLSFVWARRRLDDDTRMELDAHLELLTERYISQGMSPGEAYTAARRQFGNAVVTRERVRGLNSIGWIEQVSQDLRYALRQLRGSPGYSAVVAATLGLGIGGTTAVFSVVQAVLLAPLPYERPGQLVRFYQQDPDAPGTRDVLSGPHFTFLREHAASFADVAVLANYRETGVDLATADGRVERLRSMRVSSGYFITLLSPLALGQGFDRHDETGTQRVVLSDRVWRTRFGADPSIVGATIRLSGEAYEVAGVARPGFEDPVAPDTGVWLPYRLARDVDPENNSLTGIGRLRNGVTLEQARAELATLIQPMRERWPKAKQSAIIALPLHENIVARARGPLHLVFAAAGLVLLLACGNVANLALVRATSRVREFAVRSALGSSRRRLVRQLLVENLLLASLGAVLGLALAAAGIDVLQDLGRDALPRVDEVELNASVLMFMLVATATTAVTCGVAPMLRLAGVAPIEALRQRSRAAAHGRGLTRLRGALVIAQVGLALTLLTGAGILLASFYRLQQVTPGFRVEGVLTFELNLPSARYDAARRASAFEDVALRLETIPGVIASGGISRLPGTGSYHPWNTRIRSGPLAGQPLDRSRFAMQQRVVSGNAFAALGIPILTGRGFDASDHAGAPGRAVVSANFARQAFPGVPFDGVLGQQISAGGRDLDIIGVVGDVALDVYGVPTMIVYHAHRQFADDRNWALMQVVAAQGALEPLLSAVRGEVARFDPELVVHQPATMSDVLERGASRERFALALMGAFALVSLVLAALGLYGVLAYTVRERTAEIGIRIALGATAGQVRALVFGHAAAVVALGVAGGVAGALALGRSLGWLAFGVSPSDPRILTATAALLVLVAGAAAWLPAQRATRVDPMMAMRDGQ